jgi:hypothetical protein
MNIELLEKYINILDDNKINNFLIKNDINLNDEEYSFLKTIIKEKYKDLLDENTYLFKLIKDTINEDAYYKLLTLFNKYKILIKK